METTSDNSNIQLVPFIHQVGGHSSMLCLDEATVCKPLVPRELQFYQTLPDAVRKFTPKFYGIIKVNVVHEEEGYVTLQASPPACYQPKQSNRKRNTNRDHLMWKCEWKRSDPHSAFLQN